MRALLLAAVVSALGCKAPDPWAPCREAGPVGFTGQPLTCTTTTCRACSAALDQAWHDRRDPARATAFRLQFMRSAAPAREAFAQKNLPDGTYPYEHCTAGLAPDARCAQYGTYCIELFSRALRSGDTPLSQRVQLDLAASQACPGARNALLEELTRCAPVADGACTSNACRDCAAGYIAAASVLGPRSTEAEVAPRFRALVDAAPEPVARAIVEALGGPEPPADVEPVVVARATRAWCLSLLDRARRAPPFACFRTVAQTLASPRAADFDRAWDLTRDAEPDTRVALLGAFTRQAAASQSVDAATTAKLRVLPRDEVVAALRRTMDLPTTSDAGYATLRGQLGALGVPPSEMPPEHRPAPSTDAPPERSPAEPAHAPRLNPRAAPMNAPERAI